MDTTEIGGYRFKDERLALEALTHRSHRHEHPDDAEDYERLEFLGDAVIGLIVAADLFRLFPQAREGALTEIRASLVSKGGLAEVGIRLGLPERARLGEGERASDRGRAGLAASLFESVVGSVYLDGGLDAARTFVRESLGEKLAAATLQRSAKMALQEWAQAKHGAKPVYRTLETTGPSHRRKFTVEVGIEGLGVLGHGAGESRRAAEDAAASVALEQVKA